MTNYELIPIRIPRNPQEVEVIEKELERISGKGGELVTTMPSPQNDFVFGIFRVAQKGIAPKEIGGE